MFSYLSPSSPSTITHSRPPYHDGPSLPYLKAWFVRESLAFPLWLVAMCGDIVGWRDNGERYRVTINGSVERVKGEVGDNFIDRIVDWGIVKFCTEVYTKFGEHEKFKW